MSNTTEADFPKDLYGRDRRNSHGAPRNVDGSGRIMVTELSDREIAEETLATLRQISDVISQIGANPSGMMARFMPGMSGVMDAINKR